MQNFAPTKSSSLHFTLLCCIQVRVAGVSIAAALTATEAGRITMATQCHNVPGGIWGVAFGLLLDPAECSAVRQQVSSPFCYNVCFVMIFCIAVATYRIIYLFRECCSALTQEGKKGTV